MNRVNLLNYLSKLVSMRTRFDGPTVMVLVVIASQRVRAKRGPMTGSAKQSSFLSPKQRSGLLRRFAPRDDDPNRFHRALILLRHKALHPSS